MSMVLFNISNHPSNGWSNEQRRDWDEIVDISFPNIPAQDGMLEVENAACYIASDVVQSMRNRGIERAFISLQGDYSFCHVFQQQLNFVLDDSCNRQLDISFVFPTSERRVVENEDGTITRTFQFVQWRGL